MEPIPRIRSALYPKLLGDSWRDLDAAIQRFHGSGVPLHATGMFQVRHGSHWFARALARLARLPAPGDDVEVRLLVTPRDEGEEWRRTFAGRPLVSVQSAGADGLLVERVGLVEMRFRLEVAGGALGY